MWPEYIFGASTHIAPVSVTHHVIGVYKIDFTIPLSDQRCWYRRL